MLTFDKVYYDNHENPPVWTFYGRTEKPNRTYCVTSQPHPNSLTKDFEVYKSAIPDTTYQSVSLATASDHCPYVQEMKVSLRACDILSHYPTIPVDQIFRTRFFPSSILAPVCPIMKCKGDEMIAGCKYTAYLSAASTFLYFKGFDLPVGAKAEITFYKYKGTNQHICFTNFSSQGIMLAFAFDTSQDSFLRMNFTDFMPNGEPTAAMNELQKHLVTVMLNKNYTLVAIGYESKEMYINQQMQR
jgi:hypothetical protein